MKENADKNTAQYNRDPLLGEEQELPNPPNEVWLVLFVRQLLVIKELSVPVEHRVESRVRGRCNVIPGIFPST